MMEYKDDETDKLRVIQPLNRTEKDREITDKTDPVQRNPPNHHFQKWMNSFRARKRVPHTIPERYVEGWSDSSTTDFPMLTALPRRGSIQGQHWERSSGRSSHLGTVKTASMSITSQSIARSRGTTQSTTTQSAVSDMRISADSSRPTWNNCLDQAAALRATKRRQVLRELLATEADYVQGLKALAGVSLRTAFVVKCPGGFVLIIHSQILSMFNTRPQIYHNIQRIREVHEHFLTRLQTASPISALPLPDEASDVVSPSLSKRLSTLDLPGLKGLQNRSPRTRSLKASIKQRLMTLEAESLEGLEVAREIEKLVRATHFLYFTTTNPDATVRVLFCIRRVLFQL